MRYSQAMHATVGATGGSSHHRRLRDVLPAPGAISATGGMAEPAGRATTLGGLFSNRNEFY